MLELLERILSKFDDNVLLSDLTEADTPAYTLYLCYLDVQAEHDNVAELPDDAKTGDLKSMIRQLSSEYQAELLDKRSQYSEETNNSVSVGDDQDSFVKQIWNDVPLRRWIVKAMVYFAFFIITLAVGVGFATAYYTGNLSDGIFTNTVMNTGMEIFKLIFLTK